MNPEKNTYLYNKIVEYRQKYCGGEDGNGKINYVIDLNSDGNIIVSDSGSWLTLNTSLNISDIFEQKDVNDKNITTEVDILEGLMIV